MKKFILFITFPLIGLGIAFGQVDVQKYDVLYLEENEGPLYFYPAEVEKSSVLSFDKLFGFWEIEELNMEESDAIVHFDSITTSDTTNACQIHKIVVHTNDTILSLARKDWSDWLDGIIEPEKLTRVGTFFFKDSDKESSYMYFFDFPRHYRIKREYPDITICNTKIDDLWISLYIGSQWKKKDPLLIANKKSVSCIDLDGDEIKKKNWLKKLAKFDWDNQKK